MGAAGGREPVRQRQNVLRHRPEGAELFLPLPRPIIQHQARNDPFLMHVQTTAAGMNDLHRLSPQVTEGP
jgi:hypothetical protein